ncbi:hypothetical protein QBC37DRAFT_438144 [Rhypophila decipiens]|uniref:DUF676 domain-containing protein n=1 Tax=Rhypophila decipiens TaxID=261697 RepID=A0AAN6YE00_9PEZI|nr:hypothetical protein QBC37DRAFT_438144 [Rhypophila decipiens]
MSTPETGRPVGLLELVAPKDAIVDIVFIHGLTGHREKTWSGRYGTDWAKTLLPKDLPNARMFSWGYDANILHFFDKKADHRLDDHSKQLCSDLAGVRSKNPERPILFVVHSLGGIVCENALILATTSAENHIKQISACTRGIIFLGTPLRGSDKTIWVQIGHKFAELIGQAKSKDLVSVIEKDAPRLQELGDSFSNILRDRAKTDQSIEVVFFYEEFGMGPLGHIVTKDSATVAGYEAQAIPADHVDMVRFDTNAEPGYVRIKVVLERWIEALKRTGKATPVTGINIHQEVERMMGGTVVGYVAGSTTFTSNVYGSDKCASG